MPQIKLTKNELLQMIEGTDIVYELAKEICSDKEWINSLLTKPIKEELQISRADVIQAIAKEFLRELSFKELRTYVVDLLVERIRDEYTFNLHCDVEKRDEQ